VASLAFSVGLKKDSLIAFAARVRSELRRARVSAAALVYHAAGPVAQPDRKVYGRAGISLISRAATNRDARSGI
jgi:hypothetical protein